jgi:hypothetical protein
LLTDQNHGYEDPDTPIGRQVPVNRPVSIGAGSWLGAGAIILPGTAIGANVVVAAGSVVRGEIPDRCVVAGIPARVVREYTPFGWQSPRPPRRELGLLGEVTDRRAQRGDGVVQPDEAVLELRRGHLGEPGRGLLDR